MSGDHPSELSNVNKEQDEGSAQSSLPLPSTNTSTNLLVADIILRSASTLLRRNVEKRIALDGAETEADAQQVLDGRTLLVTLGLYGASKLATRSLPGLAFVTGGLVAKTLYDRGIARQKRLRRLNKEASEE